MLKILIVDDDPFRRKKLKAVYASHYCVLADGTRPACDQLEENDFDIIQLDHDLDDDGSGVDVARLVANLDHQPLTIIHSENPDGVAAIRLILPDGLELPFSRLLERSGVGARLKAVLADPNARLSEIREVVRGTTGSDR